MSTAAALFPRATLSWPALRLDWRHGGLLLILVLNFAVRCGLEHHQHTWYFDLTHRHFAFGPALLLPTNISEDQVVWIGSSLYPVDVLSRLLGVNKTFYLLNALVIVCSYVTGWLLCRSRVFAYTLAIGMAFGTQFHYSYVLSGTFAIYLQVCYLEILVLCAGKMLTAPRTARWRAGFASMLVFMAIGFETWLNFYVFLVGAGAFLYVYFRRRGELARLAEIRFALITATVLLAIWLPIKLTTGHHHFSAGREDEVILTYRRPLLAVEDFGSNLVTYTFMSVTNYLPPAFVTSNSDFRHGTDKVLSEQHGYHDQYGALVASHHLFLWYMHAGFVFAGYLYFLGRSSLRALRDGSPTWACLAVMLLGIGAGAATHVMIKYRPYMSVPALSYKCMPGILAMTYLIAFVLMTLRERWARRRLSAFVVASVWLLMAYSGLSRPALLNHLHGKVGLNPLPVDPAKRLVEISRSFFEAGTQP